jgi:hypothetical protein
MFYGMIAIISYFFHNHREFQPLRAEPALLSGSDIGIKAASPVPRKAIGLSDLMLPFDV